MTLMDRLEQSKAETFRMRSERVLESDNSLLTLGRSRAAGLDEERDVPKFCLRLMDKNNGLCSEFIEEGFGEWSIQQNGQDCCGKRPIDKELLDVIFKGENPLMKKAILGITAQKRENGNYLGDLIQKGLSRVGLSVSKDGSIQEMIPAQMVKGQERS